LACEANEVFAILPGAIDAALKAGGALYYPWKFRDGSHDCPPPAKDEVFVRLVTSYATQAREIDRFIATALAAIGK